MSPDGVTNCAFALYSTVSSRMTYRYCVMADIEFRCGWPHDGRHERLVHEAAGMLAGSGMDSSVIYLVPTADAAVSVRDGLLERTGHGTVFGSPVVTFNTLVKTILSGCGSSEYRVIDDTEKELVVEQVLAERVKTGISSLLTATWQSDQSRGIVRRLARLIEELKRNLCQDGAALLREVGGLGAARLGRDVADLYDGYRSYLDANNLVDSAGTFFLVHEALRESADPFTDAFPEVSHLIVDGFRDFTEVEKKILQQIVTVVDRVVFSLDYVPEAGGLFAATETTYTLYRELADIVEVSKSTRSIEHVFERCAVHSVRTGPPVDGLEIVRYTDPRSEIGEVATEIKRLLVEDGYERRPEDIVVHVPNDDMWLDAAEETFRRWGIPIEIDAKRSVGRSMAVAAVMSALRVRVSAFARADVLALLANPYIWQRPDVSVIERHSTAVRITGGSIEAWTDPLEARILALDSRDDENAAKAHHEARDLESAVGKLKDLFKEINGIPLKTRPEQFGNCILGFMAAKPAALAKSVLSRESTEWRPDISADESAALRRFGAVVREVCLAMEWCAPAQEFGLDRMVESLTTAVTETKVRPARGRSSGVVLRKWGHGAARRYDHVFLIGLTEDVLPERTPHRVFFRESHRQQCDYLKTVATGVSRGWLDLMAAVLSARERVHLSWADTGWDDKSAARSMYIDEIVAASGVEICEPDGRSRYPRDETELQKSVGAALGKVIAGTDDAGYATDLVRELRRREYGPLQSMTRGAWTEHVRAGRDTGPYGGLIEDETLVNRLEQRFGEDAHVFSVSQLEMYASCPFRFFIERVLELVPLDEFCEDVLPKDRGEIVHEILRRFFARWRTETGKCGIERDDIDDGHAIMRDEAETVLGSSRVAEYGGVFWDALQTDLCRGLKGETDRPGLLDAVLNTEVETCERPSDRYLEWRFGTISRRSGTSDPRSVDAELRLPRRVAATPSVPVRIAGKIDRIDVFNDGSYKIWDYKTSSSLPSSKDVLTGDKYQLGVYALAAERALPVQNGRLDGVGYYKLSTAEDVTRKTSGKKEKDYETMMTAVETNIIDNVTGMMAGNFIADSESDSCKHCPCRYICRT